MQVSLKDALQKANHERKSVISDQDPDFIKSQYRLENSTGHYILYAHVIGYDKPQLRRKVNALLRKGIGHYTSNSGHTIPSYLID